MIDASSKTDSMSRKLGCASRQAKRLADAHRLDNSGRKVAGYDDHSPGAGGAARRGRAERNECPCRIAFINMTISGRLWA
ncbi:hypothetical protein O1611_g5721 [Lasiodiplodia mahajangana]|uniref:Uncharacterized protein n=1 Tax=Lasiodiplodia mahajangana TaxID=1108764 RepID=A0ACC2JKD1_9PEZI|nr:hypothetical protein O1611_g5721 [Lasiodiplodia mahajangana]